MKYFADQAKIPVDQYSAQVGGEGIGVGIEVLTNLFSKGWLGKIILLATGGVASGYGIFGRDISDSMRRALIAWGTHDMLRFVDMIPSELIEFRRSIDDFVAALKRNDPEGMKAAVLRSPSEWQAMLGVMGIPTSSGEAPPVGRATVTEEAKKVEEQKPGRFIVTEDEG